MNPPPESLINLEKRKLWGPDNPPPRRLSIGFSIAQWKNELGRAMDEGTLTRADIKRIARGDPNLNRAAAAIQILQMAECPDISDFAPVLRGEAEIDALGAAGVDTTVVKKIRRRTIKRENEKTGDAVTVVTNEIELHNRAGEAIDRVINHTEGLPVKRVISQSTSLEIKVSRKIVADDDIRDAINILGQSPCPPGPENP